jgi:bis(5'-nucleosyl)-tetraphosphatase (symmetrical)
MATYAIGDIQGCYKTVTRLLETIRFDAERDRLWLVGDLVNRGPDSLSVLRWAKGLGDRLTAVLGNHDFHLLALAEGFRVAKPRDTVGPILEAPDRDELLDWVSRLPMLHREGEFVMVHAGLLPAWSLRQAEGLAEEVEESLRSSGRRELLRCLYEDDSPLVWTEELTGNRRLRVITNAMATLRLCTEDGQPGNDFSGPPELAPPGHIPWFDVPNRKSRDATIVFGHWAALGHRMGPGIIALDSGCVWGGPLTAVRLEDRKVFQVPSVD